MVDCGQLQAPPALPTGKSPQHPLDKRLGGPQSRSGRGGEDKILRFNMTNLSTQLKLDKVQHKFRVNDTISQASL